MPNDFTLTMPTFVSSITKELRPEQIDTVEEYTLLNGLFSPLVIFDNSGRLEANFASEFYWENPETLVFSFSRDQHTIDGRPLGAADALVSLKRMILLNKNMHGNLRDRMSIPESFKSIDDDLPCLYVKDSKLYIKTNKKDYFILHVLASADFVIIPSASIDWNTLEIKDFRNTTGPYFLSHEDQYSAVFSQNRGHFRLKDGNASQIILKKYERLSDQLTKDFELGLVDHIPTVSPLTSQNYLKLAKEPGVVIHETRDVMLYYGFFTKTARLRLSSLERFALANKIQMAIQAVIPRLTDKAIVTNQFFHEEGVGGLAPELAFSARQDRVSGSSVKSMDVSSYPLTIEATAGFMGVIQPILKDEFKNAKFVISDRIGKIMHESESDVVFAGVDVGLKEDFTGISFAAELGLFPLDGIDKANWLLHLSSQEDSRIRAAMIEQLHLRALYLDTTLIPLYRLPTYALSRNGWKMDLPRLWVTERLWQIYKD